MNWALGKTSLLIRAEGGGSYILSADELPKGCQIMFKIINLPEDRSPLRRNS